MLILLSTLACYQENLPEMDFVGTVVLPRAAATRAVPSGATGTETTTDVRFIGPVFLGAYSGIDTVSFPYPHPSMGPILDPTIPGDAFPYGGTSVGRYDFACYDILACKVVTGRFTDYNDLLDYFRMIGQPVTDFEGTEIVDGSVMQQECFYYYHATSDAEIAFIGAPEFTENADGDFEAAFTMPHTTFHEGMALWGYMDSPIIDTASFTSNGAFTTCSDSAVTSSSYNNTYTIGEQVSDALNYPSLSITAGDWVGDGNTVVSKADDTLVINLSVEYTGE